MLRTTSRHFSAFLTGSFIKQRKFTPTRLESLESFKIINISAGYSHILFQTSDNDLYSLGMNRSGQCGVDSNADSGTDYFVSPVSHKSIISSISMIACGKDYSIAVADDKKTVFGCGSNENGQLGLGNLKPTFAFTQLKTFEDEIQFITCGATSTWVLLNSNKLYCFGGNHFGELGSGDSFPRPKPHLLDLSSIGEKILSVASGMAHTCLLTENGSVFSSGRGQDGQLGLNLRQSHKFVKISLPEPMMTVKCGMASSVAIGKSGKLYYWGVGMEKDLGGEVFDRKATIPYQYNVLDSDVMNVWSGAFHCVYQKKDRTMFGFGLWSDGQLACDQKSIGRGPHKFQFDGKVVNVACGGHFTLIL